MNYYKINKEIAEGFITHEDQSKVGLKFEITGDIVGVDGDNAAVEEWVKREGLTETATEADVITLKDAALKNTVEYRLAALEEKTKNL